MASARHISSPSFPRKREPRASDVRRLLGPRFRGDDGDGVIRLSRICFERAGLSLRAFLLLLPVLLFAAPAARAHAFLDHASPAVGSTVRQPPAAISIWFTQELEPAFSTVTITDQSGQRVDGGDAKVDARDQTLLRASLKPLPPGTYKVSWHVVSVDTHTTEGTFTFRVAG
jgi:copper resistance protein C